MNAKLLAMEFLRWQFWSIIRILVQHMSPLAGYKIAEYMAQFYYYISKYERKAISNGFYSIYQNNITPKKIRKLTFKTMDHIVKTTIDKFYYPLMNEEFCLKYIQYHGLHFLDDALKAKRGVVLLHSHLGNPHWIMPAIGHLGYKLNQIASRNEPEQIYGCMSWFINKIRNYIYQIDINYKEQLPVSFIYTDGSLRKLYEALKRNEILATAIDGREGEKSIDLDFLKHKAIFFTGVIRFILRTKPIVLPTFHLRNSDNTQTIIIEGPMEIENTGNIKNDIYRNMVTFVKKLESYVYNYPWLYAEAFTLSEPFIKFPNNLSDKA